MELCAGYAWGKVEGEESEAVWKLRTYIIKSILSFLDHTRFSSAQPGEGLVSYKYCETKVEYNKC